MDYNATQHQDMIMEHMLMEEDDTAQYAFSVAVPVADWEELMAHCLDRLPLHSWRWRHEGAYMREWVIFCSRQSDAFELTLTWG
jgi:anti-sigma factor ChrR (cupin superfamily)